MKTKSSEEKVKSPKWIQPYRKTQDADYCPYKRILSWMVNYCERRNNRSLLQPIWWESDLGIVAEEISKMPYWHRKIVELLFFQKLSFEEAGERIGAHKIVVLVHLQSVLSNLRYVLVRNPRFSRFKEPTIAVSRSELVEQRLALYGH